MLFHGASIGRGLDQPSSSRCTHHPSGLAVTIWRWGLHAGKDGEPCGWQGRGKCFRATFLIRLAAHWIYLQRRGEQTVFPVTIKQIIDAASEDDVVKIDGREVNQV